MTQQRKVRRRVRVRPTRDETREIIMKAAADVFRERGFQPAGIEEIAERAGFTKGAVYSSFSNKDELFLELLERRVEERAAHVEAAMQGAPRGREGARALGRALGELMDQDPDWTPLLLEFWIHALRNPRLRAKLGAVRQRLRQSIAAGFHDDMPIPAETAATLVFALANGLGLERLTDPAAVPPSMLPLILERLLPSSFE